MRVCYSSLALRQLDQIFSYIAKDSPKGARRMVERIASVADLLGSQPRMGRATSGRDLYVQPISGTPYIIYYKILLNDVRIVRIRHGARRRVF
jgi:addiction module RelE/StbE family toxin